MISINRTATAAALLCVCWSANAAAERVVYDLTHAIPTFAPSADNLTQPDLGQPFKDSTPVAGFGPQATRAAIPNFDTSSGFFQWGKIVIDEHYGTHVDSTHHFVNTPETLDVDKPDARTIEQYTTADLIGPVVFIDIGARVAAELAKNGGKPSPDPKVTDFSNAGGATVGADDIAAIADQITDRAWIVVHSGWDQFYHDASETSAYINGFNFPGFSQAAIDKLIAIEKERGVRLNGLVMDNLSIDSGQNGLGSKGDIHGDGWYAHVHGLQRGWKFVENAAAVGQLAGAKPGDCELVVGAIKLTGGSGAPARVLALCQR